MEDRLRGGGAIDRQVNRELHRRHRVSGSSGRQGGLNNIVRPKPAPELHLRQLTADSGLSTTPTISQDGKLVAYASDRAGEGNLDIWVQPLTQGARPIRLTNDPSDDLDPSFSPDGGQIVFRSRRADGGIYLVPSLGGNERLLVRGGHSPRSFAASVPGDH